MVISVEWGGGVDWWVILVLGSGMGGKNVNGFVGVGYGRKKGVDEGWLWENELVIGRNDVDGWWDELE